MSTNTICFVYVIKRCEEVYIIMLCFIIDSAIIKVVSFTDIMRITKHLQSRFIRISFIENVIKYQSYCCIIVFLYYRILVFSQVVDHILSGMLTSQTYIAYLNKPNPTQPYNLVVVPKSKLDKEHFIMSSFGVMHVTPTGDNGEKFMWKYLWTNKYYISIYTDRGADIQTEIHTYWQKQIRYTSLAKTWQTATLWLYHLR